MKTEKEIYTLYIEGDPAAIRTLHKKLKSRGYIGSGFTANIYGSGSLIAEIIESHKTVRELTNRVAGLEASEARAKWLEGLVRSAHKILKANGAEKSADLLWTSFSTPPQFDKDGVK